MLKYRIPQIVTLTPNERLTYKFVTVFIVTENRNELVTINLHRVAF